MKARRKSDGKIVEVEIYMLNSRRCKDGSWESSYKDINSGLVYEASDLLFNLDYYTVIQGWVAIDEAYGQCFLHTEKPIQKAQPIADTGDYDTVWDSNGKTYLIDVGLFSDMDSDSDPTEVEIIIKRKKK